MSDAAVHSEFGVKKPKKGAKKSASAGAAGDADAEKAVDTAPAPGADAVASAAGAPADAAADAHPEFGSKKKKGAKASAAGAEVPVAAAAGAPLPPSSQPDAGASSVTADDTSSVSAKKKGVRFDVVEGEHAAGDSSKGGKSVSSIDEEAAVSTIASFPELESHLPRYRFYENDFPEQEEFVVVKVQSIEEMGAYVTLLEYNGVQGMILLSELSRRRIRSIHKLLRVGHNEIVMVIRGDKDKSGCCLADAIVQRWRDCRLL